MMARVVSRFGTYWKSLLQDYGAALKDIVKDSRSRPGKAALMLAGSGAVCVLVATNPGPDSFLNALCSSSNDLLLLSDGTRNPESEAYVRHLETCRCHGALRSWDLLLATVVWESDHAEDCDLYAARCTYLKSSPLTQRHRLIDIGLIGMWLNLRRKMKDCDINYMQWQ